MVGAGNDNSIPLAVNLIRKRLQLHNAVHGGMQQQFFSHFRDTFQPVVAQSDLLRVAARGHVELVFQIVTVVEDEKVDFLVELVVFQLIENRNVGSPMLRVATEKVVVMVIVGVSPRYRCFRVGIQEVDAVGGCIHEGAGNRFAFVLRLVEIVQLLGMQLRDGKGVSFEKEGAAIGPCDKSHVRIPLAEVLHKFPSPRRQRVCWLARRKRQK